YSSVVADYFKQADNMTAQQSALQIAVHQKLACKQELLDAFEQQWLDTPLVLDKWFAIQASTPDAAVVERVHALQQHARFDRNNPNRQYALFATFGRNMTQFHRLDGAGYRMTSEMIQYLNDKNPLVAARLVTPLTQWRRFDNQRQKLLKAELEQLQRIPNLAADLEEKI